MTELEISKKMRSLSHGLAKLEETAIKKEKICKGLTVNEMHIIECIKTFTNGHEGPSISKIAASLDITRPSTTVAVNKLVKKGYASKSDCKNDGRSVRVKLTRKGEKAFTVHEEFTVNVINEMSAFVSKSKRSTEFDRAVSGIEKLCAYFESVPDKEVKPEDDF